MTVSKHSEDGMDVIAGLSPAMRPCKRSEENRTVNGVRELTAVSPIVFRLTSKRRARRRLSELLSFPCTQVTLFNCFLQQVPILPYSKLP